MSIKHIDVISEILDKCSATAKKSTCHKSQHGAAIIDSNGNIKAIAHNSSIIHAEVAVIEKLSKRSKGYITKNDTIVVCRTNIKSESAPCKKCLEYIKKYTLINNIVYATSNIEEMNIKYNKVNQLLQTQMHLSSKDRKKQTKQTKQTNKI